jgi:hypothetical protein
MVKKRSRFMPGFQSRFMPAPRPLPVSDAQSRKDCCKFILFSFVQLYVVLIMSLLFFTEKLINIVSACLHFYFKSMRKSSFSILFMKC